MADFDYRALPGGELVEAGIRDLAAGRGTEAALAVGLAATRLRAAGVPVPPGDEHPAHSLYDLLARQDAAAAHGRYNALIRRIASFARAAEHARAR